MDLIPEGGSGRSCQLISTDLHGVSCHAFGVNYQFEGDVNTVVIVNTDTLVGLILFRQLSGLKITPICPVE